jgi:hypothetical protein
MLGFRLEVVRLAVHREHSLHNRTGTISVHIFRKKHLNNRTVTIAEQLL